MSLLPLIGLILGIILITTAASLGYLRAFAGKQVPQSLSENEPLSLLFDKGILHHGTREATHLLGLMTGEHDWTDLRDALIARFPDFPEHLDDSGQLSLRALDDNGPQTIEVRWRDALTWVTLLVAPDPAQDGSVESTELSLLRRATQTAPNPIWQEDNHGTVSWYNKAYADLYRETLGGLVDRNKRLFSDGDPMVPNRVALKRSNGKITDWFELKTTRSGDITVFHATNIKAVIAAEVAQRNFVQTLAKTFAHLSIGLAIFDRRGQLILFNPALVDLTGLGAPFLSARPTMLSFFDALRENRRMPEPKNYSNWRQEIAEVIAAATDGRYRETWTLESGQTYSVNGRQHPDGATAFLIEDISAEMTLTRNFRTELEQAQTMVNAVEDAMGIFSPSSILTLSNAAFHQIWGIDPDAAFADVTLHDCTQIWKDACADEASKITLERVLTGAILGVPKTVQLTLKTGEAFDLEVTHLPSGCLLVRFRLTATSKPAKQTVIPETA